MRVLVLWSDLGWGFSNLILRWMLEDSDMTCTIVPCLQSTISVTLKFCSDTDAALWRWFSWSSSEVNRVQRPRVEPFVIFILRTLALVTIGRFERNRRLSEGCLGTCLTLIHSVDVKHAFWKLEAHLLIFIATFKVLMFLKVLNPIVDLSQDSTLTSKSRA